MRNYIIGFAATAAILLSACNGHKEFSPSVLKRNGELLVDQEVKVTGKVLRVSYPVGKGMTLVDSTDSTLIHVRAGENTELFSPNLMGKTITLTGELKVRKITKEDVVRMDSVLSASDSLFARLDSIKASREENDSLDARPRHGMGRHHGRPQGEEMGHAPKGGREAMHGPIPPHKAKFIKEKQEEIKKWFSENSDKEYYPEYYIEAIKLSPASRVYNKFTPQDSIRLQKHHAFDKKKGKRRHHRDGERRPERRPMEQNQDQTQN